MLLNLFRSVDKDNSGEISASELQSAVSAFFVLFILFICRRVEVPGNWRL
jgi:hypothetical protein